jgi:hypothetical protein
MSQKPKHKKKRKKQIKPLTQPTQGIQSPNPIAIKPRQFLTKLGLVLTFLGFLTWIELFPRLSATASSPLDLSNQLASSKFTVVNEGYLQVTDVMSACYLWSVAEGGAHFNGSIARVVVPPESRLRPTEGLTVPCTSEKMFTTNPPFFLSLRNADLAIVVYYRVWPFTFIRTHRLFRFVARIGKQGEVVWDKQPADVLEPEFDKWIEEHGGEFPPTIPAFHP